MRIHSKLVTSLAVALFSLGCGSSPSDGASATGAGAGGTGDVGGAGGTGTGGAAGSAQGGAGGSSGSDVLAACTAQSMAVCAKQDECRSQLATREYGSVSECVTRQTDQCVRNHMAPGSGATAATTQACAATWSSASCAVATGLAPVCPPVAGTLAEGAACAVNGQCASSFCSVADGSACGTCAAIPAMGAACESGHCGPTELSCDATSMTCLAPGASGATCSKTEPCGPGLGCVGKAGASTCQPLVATVGGACDTKSTTLPRCDGLVGLSCDTSNTCQMDKLATAGQPCGVDATTSAVTLCSGRSTCVEPAGTNAGSCMAPAADGAACDTAAGPPCEAPARCVVSGGTAGTCQVLDGAKCM